MPELHSNLQRRVSGAPRPAAMTARAVAALLATLALAAPWTPANAVGKRMSAKEIQDYSEATGDPMRASWAVSRLRNFLASDPDSAYALFARRMLIRGLNSAGAPVQEIVAAADTISGMIPNDPRVTVFFYGEMAQLLLDRGGAADRALIYARLALANVPEGPQYSQVRAATLGTLGQAQLETGSPDAALVSLTTALGSSPDSQAVLHHIGRVYEAQKKNEMAIGAYARSLGVYMGRDTSAAAPLRALWRKSHGSLAGMNARVEAARAASRKRIAFDARRDDRPAPDWKLTDLGGKTVQSSDFKGKVIVLDFWGSWCGPCRQELPIFQAMYERFRNQGVVFIGMNYERPIAGKDLKQVARDFIEQNKYTFPVIFDHEHIATEAYGIEGFPTVFLIDKTGNIRYKNVGVTEGIETILADQIQSLMD